MARLVHLPAAFLAVGLLAGPGGAESQDLQQRLKACAVCHGEDGNARLQTVPSLAAQPRVFIENQLVFIREGLRDIPAMKGVLDGVSDADIAAMARHYAAQSLAPPPPSPDPALFDRGRRLAESMRCGSCHLPDYTGREQMPRLAGQREDYLLHSMRQFQTNQATGRDTIMAASLYGIADADLRAIAHFLAHATP